MPVCLCRKNQWLKITFWIGVHEVSSAGYRTYCSLKCLRYRAGTQGLLLWLPVRKTGQIVIEFPCFIGCFRFQQENWTRFWVGDEKKSSWLNLWTRWKRKSERRSDVIADDVVLVSLVTCLQLQEMPRWANELVILYSFIIMVYLMPANDILISSEDDLFMKPQRKRQFGLFASLHIICNIVHTKHMSRRCLLL